jgi:hypothetical protein
MKIFTNTTHYDYDWEHVSTANWQKYSPWNEKTPHVIAVDTLSRHVDQASGVVSYSLDSAYKRIPLTSNDSCVQNASLHANKLLHNG